MLDDKDAATKGFTSFGKFVLQKLRELGDRVILVDGITGVEVTAKQMLELSVQCARCLEKLGVGKGDAVGIFSENRIEFAYTMFAIFLLNATFSPFNVTYSEDELVFVMSLSKPKVLFVSKAINNLPHLGHKCSSFLKFIICFDEKISINNVIPFKKFMTTVEIEATENYTVGDTDVNEDIVMILCSSGTTGLPKGVQISQLNILKTTDNQVHSKKGFRDAVNFCVIPWFHTYGAFVLITSTIIGSKLVFLPKFDAIHFLRCIETYKINVTYMVPPLMVWLAKTPLVNNYDLSSLQFLYCGAAPLTKDVSDAVKKRLGIQIIRQGYGLSESTITLLAQTDTHEKSGSVGILRPGLYAKVIDTESGRILGPNETGELCFKGPIIMKGYVGDAKATKEVIDKEGWLHTGDIGYYDEDLEFFIVDRIKELIKYKGYQVAPVEIEGLLLTHPMITDAAVIGKPDDLCGELPLAFVVKKTNASLTEQELIEFVAKKVSPAKRLHGGVKFVSEIPKNPSGKILRRLLRDMVNTEKSKL